MAMPAIVDVDKDETSKGSLDKGKGRATPDSN